MYKLCKTEQSAARQRELEKGLQALMLEKHFDEISIMDLCGELNIPRKSFYRYFSGKEGALQALVDHTLMEFEWPLFQESHMKQQELSRFFCFWKERKAFLDAIIQSGRESYLVQRTVSQGFLDAGVPFEFAGTAQETRRYSVLFAICGLMSAVLSWHQQGYRPGAEKMAEITGKILTEPLISPNS